MKRQMEGDNEERRKKARQAREEGKSPSAEQVTTGASKQRHHQPRSEDHDTKVERLRAGKQGGAVQEQLPGSGRPR